LAETLLANIVETNKNIDQNRKTMGVLQEILNQRLTSAAQEQASGEARVTRAVQKNTELINNNLKVADEKINRLAATLKTLEAQKIETDSALNTLLNTLKEDLGHVQASNQTADPKLNILIDASQQIAAQSSQIQLGLQESVKGVGASQAKVDLANQKLAKLIEILKTIAAEQEKAQQVLKGQGKVLNTQQAIKKALVDLKNKANVNISRNNAILKKIGK
jgi:DNA repair exonuclease SbcCD ATPase subunit